MPQAPSKKITGLSNSMLSVVVFSSGLEGSKSDSLTKARQGPEIPSKFTTNKPPIHNGKLFEKFIHKLIQSHLEVNNLLNANQFEFRARHSTTLQCMRLADHVTLNFNMTTAAVFSDIEKAFDTIWHPGLLFKLSKLTFGQFDNAYRLRSI
jgi:hypothetical protein